jgi:hypothetical protein
VHYHQKTAIPWRLYRPGSENAAGLTFYRCPTCNLVVKDPRIHTTAEQARAHYAKHNNDLSNDGYRLHLEKLVDPLLKTLPHHATGLDYGCGPSISIERLLQKQGVACSSFDPIFFPCHEVLKENSYDFITCSEVAEHFTDPRGEFTRLHSLLRPKGLLAVMTQLTPSAFEGWWYHRDPTHVVFYSAATFHWIAQHLGMKILVESGDVFIFQA